MTAEEVKTYKRPPLIRTNQHPEDIIGQAMRFSFMDHFKKTAGCNTSEEFEKAVKGVPDDTRKAIADIHIELRNNGFIPLRIDSRGSIVWGIILTSEYAHKNEFYPSAV